MSHQRGPTTGEAADISLEMTEGWHCTHFYYRFDRERLAAMTPADRQAGRAALVALLTDDSDGAPARLQTSVVSGGKADFGLMVLDANPLRVDAVHQRVMASPLGGALQSTYSFVSVTELSEYIPTVAQYGARIIAEGEEDGSPAYNTKIKAYEQREVHMRRQRLTPDLPSWPATCFYPMNKSRVPGANWFMLDVDERQKLMSEHGRTGMGFAGKVTQLITVALGFDDWEWGVTLWARNPEFLKEIVYRMRFDEASAKYAEFGPFYTSYVCSPEAMLDHCLV